MPSHAETLRHFMKQVRNLEETRFLRSSSTWDWGVTHGVPRFVGEGSTSSDGSSISVSYTIAPDLSTDDVLKEMFQVRRPDRDDVAAYLLALRRFIAQDEELHLFKIYNFAERSLPDGFTKCSIRMSRQRHKTALETYTTLIRVGNRDFEPPQRFVVDLWLQGVVFHDNSEKRAALGLEELPGPVREALEVQFLTFTLSLTPQIILVRKLLGRAFRLKLIDG